jgi:hypothetical protein
VIILHTSKRWWWWWWWMKRFDDDDVPVYRWILLIYECTTSIRQSTDLSMNKPQIHESTVIHEWTRLFTSQLILLLKLALHCVTQCNVCIHSNVYFSAFISLSQSFRRRRFSPSSLIVAFHRRLSPSPLIIVPHRRSSHSSKWGATVRADGERRRWAATVGGDDEICIDASMYMRFSVDFKAASVNSCICGRLTNQPNDSSMSQSKWNPQLIYDWT